jgi:hypothetical protein
VLRTCTAHRESSELGGDVGGEPRKVGQRMVFPLVIGEMAEPAKWSSRRAHWFLSPDQPAALWNISWKWIT